MINYLNYCLQYLGKIESQKCSIVYVLLIPVVLGLIHFFYSIQIEKKYKNDEYILNDNPNHNELNKYKGVIHNIESKYFKCNYFYFVNELYVTLAAALILAWNILDFEWEIINWQESKLEIILIAIIFLIISKIIIQGFLLGTLFDAFILVSQILLSVVLTSRLPLILFWYTYPIGLIASIYMHVRYKKLKKNPVEMFKGTVRIVQYTADNNSNSGHYSSRGTSYNYRQRPRYKSEKESLYEMKHPSATSTQMSNMMKFGENRPNG